MMMLIVTGVPVRPLSYEIKQQKRRNRSIIPGRASPDPAVFIVSSLGHSTVFGGISKMLRSTKEMKIV